MNEVLHNVVFEYDDYVLPDKERERFLRNQAKIWFEPLVGQINSQPGTINFFLKEGFENRVSFNGFTEDLYFKMSERWKLFQVPQPQ